MTILSGKSCSSSISRATFADSIGARARSANARNACASSADSLSAVAIRSRVAAVARVELPSSFCSVTNAMRDSGESSRAK